MLVIILCFVASVIMYFAAPGEYSFSYSMIGLVVFLLPSIVLLRNNCKDSLVKFEFFFIVVFFFSNIVYSVFYYPVNPYFLLFNYGFNENYINRGLGLSLVAFTAFCGGVYDPFLKTNPVKKEFAAVTYKEPKTIAYILFAFYIPYAITFIALDEYVTDFTKNSLNALLIFILYYLVFAVFYNNKDRNSISSFIKSSNSLLLFIGLFLYIAVYLIIGSRSIPITIILLCFFFYHSLIKKVSNRNVVLLIILGAVFMMGVSIFRARGQMNTDIFSSVLDVGMDLTINNRSLYVLMEHADLNGLTFGRTMLLNILAVIPFAQGIFVKITGLRLANLSSAELTTALYYDEITTNEDIVGLGTNIVGDVYVAFGFIGVIVFFYFLGRILKKLNRKILSGNHIALFVYAMIFIDVVFIARACILEPLRNIAWGLLWIFLFNGSLKKYQSEK